MPYISTEALVGGALIVALALGYQYLPTSGTAEAGGASGNAPKKNNKRKNKKKGKAAGVEGEGLSSAVATPADSDVSADTVAKKGKAKSKGKTRAAPSPPRVPPAVAAPDEASSEAEAPSPPSFAAAAGGSAAQPAKPKLLAEKILPKPRKTKVDDMLEPEDRAPQIARVMKITSGSSAPAPVGFAASEKVPKFEDDYADSTSDSVTDTGVQSEDEWNVVASKKKPVSLSIGGGSSYGSSSHAGAETHTKLQRKNQKKAEAKKAQKAAEEADRLRRLAMHKRDLERQRIDEIYKQKTKVVKQGGKVVSGGSSAQVTDTGKLVWD